MSPWTLALNAKLVVKDSDCSAFVNNKNRVSNLTLLRLKVRELGLGPHIDLLERLEEEVDEGDEPPGDQPYEEKVNLLEPADEHQVADLNLVNLYYVCAAQVLTEEAND